MTENLRQREHAIVAELAASIEKSAGGSLEQIYGQAATALRRAAIDADTLRRINDGFRQMAAIAAKLNSFKVPPEFFFVTGHLKQFQQAINQLNTQPLQDLVAQLQRMKLPEPFLSDALLASGLHSPVLHTPNYSLPEIEPIRTAEDVEARRKQAKRCRLVACYDILAQLEESLRNLIETKLREIHGDNWWKRGVPNGVRDACEERKRAKQRPFEASHDPICYAYIDDYRAIIAKRDNWDRVFDALFGNKSELEACFMWVARGRHAVAHVRALSDDDYQRFMVAARWFRVAIARATPDGENSDL